ncbi:FAD-binding oxidoreductase [Tistrella bauzanensis]|uniref:NAD(P)/FAD-dependent oxidoreductase n=1 Tax=Tistrella TaxID=171436 RepID=UPI0031F702AF
MTAADPKASIPMSSVPPLPPEPHARSRYAAANLGRMRRRSPLDGDLVVDLCVIGGGLTGLSAALDAAERGMRVALIEARRVGWGASGRNGGQVLSGFSSGTDRLVAKVGEDTAREMWQMTVDALDLVRARIAAHGIDCDLADGVLTAAVKPRHLRDLEAEMARERRWGYDRSELIPADRIRDHVGSARYVGGMLDHGAAHLDPLAYAIGLAGAAEAAGAQIFEETSATAIGRPATTSPAGPVGRFRVETQSGAITASHVVVAANAENGRLVPEVRHKVMPVGTYVLATEPLDPALAHRLLPGNVAVSDCNFVLDYFRLSGDRRMLFGGKVSYSGRPPLNLERSMRRSMLAVFPELATVPTSEVWGGVVDITHDRTPHFTEVVPGLIVLQGFSGHGLALTALAGRLAVEAMAGDRRRFDLFDRLRHIDFPGGWARMPLLVLAMGWYRLRDMMP